MTQEITAEQAQRIHDIESYKAVTGYKRLKRTAEEMNLGLSPEDALKRRLAAFDPNWLEKNAAAWQSVQTGLAQAQSGQLSDGPSVLAEANTRANATIKRETYGTGEILIRIRPTKNVPGDYFEHLPKAEIIVTEDDKFYGWLDVFLSGRYNGTPAEFFTEALDQGIGELISHPVTETPAEPEETPNVESVSITAES